MPIYNVAGATQESIVFLTNLTNKFTDMLRRNSIANDPTRMYKVTYVDNIQNPTKRCFIIIYASLYAGSEQFNDNSNYFKVYGYKDYDGNTNMSVLFEQYYWLWSYDKNNFGYLNNNGYRIYRATGQSPQLMTQQLGNDGDYNVESIIQFNNNLEEEEYTILKH